jgi:molecular chaperone GrpE (heat shock protein)
MPNNNNADSIYSRLLAGESEEAIAQAFLDALNDAKDRYAAEKAAEEAKAAEAREKAEREKAEREKAKREDMKGLIVDFLYFIAHYYPAFGIEAADVDMLDDDTLNALADFFLLVVDLEALKPAKSRIDLNSLHSGASDLRSLYDLINELDKIEL